MTIHVLIFLVGLFVVPTILLVYGHKIRRRSPRGRAAFWGAVTGHCSAAVLAVSLGMIPPETWTSEETWRGFVGLWSLLVLPLAGAVIGFALHREPARATDARPAAATPRSSRRASA